MFNYKMNKNKEIFSDKKLSEHFNILKTGSSIGNTFLSLLRTVVVLTGVAALLIKQHKAVWFNRIFIILLIIVVLIASWQFYNDSIELLKLDKNPQINPDLRWQMPILLASILVIILVMLMIVGGKINYFF